MAAPPPARPSLTARAASGGYERMRSDAVLAEAGGAAAALDVERGDGGGGCDDAEDAPPRCPRPLRLRLQQLVARRVPALRALLNHQPKMLSAAELEAQMDDCKRCVQVTASLRRNALR
jgi:hypothetical protein